MAKLTQAHGNWVSGDRFWGRKKDIELLIDRIDAGAHTLLVAQRRMGKTSLMREVQRLLGDRYLCLFIDLQKAATAEEAIVELSLALKPHAKLWGRIRASFANILQSITGNIEEVSLWEIGVKLRDGLTAGNWREKGDALFAILADSDQPVLLLMDEVPLMVNRILLGHDSKLTPERKREADIFMSWLRSNSLSHQGKVRIVLSGSIGLEPVLRRAGLSATVNNFQPFDLRPWDKETAVGCLQALANQYDVRFQDGAEKLMVQKLGCCIPHHVQMFFANVYEVCRRKDCMDFFPAEVDDVYENDMLVVRGHSELTHYEDRLRMMFGTGAYLLVSEVLVETAVVGFLTHDALLVIKKDYDLADDADTEITMDEIVRVLEHDGYLKRDANGYAFESRLLRDWWSARYGFGYAPALERKI